MRSAAPEDIHARGLSAAQRESIRAFLQRAFVKEGISLELLDIVMARIDAEALGRRQSELERLYPKFTSYPSVGQQLQWQASLKEIAANFRLHFPSDYNPALNDLAPAVADGEGGRPSTSYILWKIGGLIQGAQGAFSEQLFSLNLPTVTYRAGEPRRGFGKWNYPLRISVTGEKSIDGRLAPTLASIAPDLGWTAENGSTVANAFLPTGGIEGTLDMLMQCLLEPRCATVRSLSRRNPLTGSPRSESSRERFFSSLYLTNPYGGRTAATALVELDESSRILSGFCGRHDIGYLVGSDRPFSNERLSYCLSEMISPGSGEASKIVGER